MNLGRFRYGVRARKTGIIYIRIYMLVQSSFHFSQKPYFSHHIYCPISRRLYQSVNICQKEQQSFETCMMPFLECESDPCTHAAAQIGEVGALTIDEYWVTDTIYRAHTM